MGKRVLVTGGSGFVGRRLCARLRERPDLTLWTPTRAELDLADRAASGDAIAHFAPDVVLHLAARTAGAALLRAAPTATFAANVEPALGLCAACEAGAVGRVVLPHSAGAYPRPGAGARLRPDDLWRGEPGAGVYGLARRCVGALVRAATAAGGAECVELTLPSIYGPGDGAPSVDAETMRALPSFAVRTLRAHAAGAAIVHHPGSGAQTRDFLHVDDAAAALEAAIDAPVAGQRLHLGDGVARSLDAVAHTVAAAVGFTGAIAWLHPEAAATQREDCVVLEPVGGEALGWQPQWRFEAGVADAVRDLAERLHQARPSGQNRT